VRFFIAGIQKTLNLAMPLGDGCYEGVFRNAYSFFVCQKGGQNLEILPPFIHGDGCLLDGFSKGIRKLKVLNSFAIVFNRMHSYL
jgi:hypothetical protein